MKLYHISQSEVKGYDTYNGMIVCAASEEEARLIHPHQWNDYDDPWKERYSGWCSSPEYVNVEYIGEAASHLKKGIVLASFRAG